MVDENNNTKSKLSSNMPLKEAKKYTTQIQKIMHILFINSFDSNLNFITQQQIKDDTTIINKNIKYRDEILNYLISIKVLEKGGDSFFITKKFIIFLKDLKQFIESKQIFENVNSKGVSKEPIEFNSNTSTEISEFLVLLQTHFGCFQVIENNIHLNTKFSHTRSFLSFYYLINYSFAMQHCTQYIVNIGIIKEDEREEIKFSEILGGRDLGKGNDFRKKIPNYLQFLIEIMKSKGYTYVKELEVFKKNHLLDTDLKNIKVIVERLMNDLSTVLKSNPNIESLIHSLLLQKIQRRGEIYVLVYNDITISFEHLDTESILDAVVVEVERELTKDDVEHEDVDTKTTQPEINEYFVYLVRSLNNQKEADAELSSNIIKNLEQRGFKFTNQDNKIEEVIEILADRYEVDAEEIDYKVGNTKSTVKALKVRNYETQEERGNEILTSEMISELNLKVVEILKSQESKSLSYFKLSEYLLHNIKYVGEEHLSLILQEGFKQKLYTTYQDSQGNYILTLNNNEQDKVHKNGKDKEKSPLILDESLRVDNHDLDDNTIIDEIIYHIYTSNHIMSYQEIEDIIKINYPFINSKQFEEIVRKAVKDNNICYQQDSRGTFYLYLNDNQKKYASTLQEPIHPPSPLPPIEPSPFSPNPLINDGEEYEDNYNYEEERERKGIGIPTIIAGGVTLGIIGVIAWDFQEEIVNYIQDFFNSESQNVSNVEVESPIPTATASIDIHTVIRGDNLWNIAHSYLGGSATNAQILELTNNLAQINNISNPDLIHPGDQIRVPQELLEQIRNH